MTDSAASNIRPVFGEVKYHQAWKVDCFVAIKRLLVDVKMVDGYHFDWKIFSLESLVLSLKS